ncbi:MAG: hypothetical protein ACYCW6_12835 [Candidatus Xenobia bacterium]
MHTPGEGRTTTLDRDAVPGADPYIRCPLTAEDLARGLEHYTAEPPDRLLQLDPLTARLHLVDDADAAGRQLLPLRLGPLQQALAQICGTWTWLGCRTPVFYVDHEDRIHIDFPSLAGFVVTPRGEVVGRAINPY